MHDSFQEISDVDHLFNDKIEIFGKILSFVKKAAPFFVGILLDSNSAKPVNFRGNGYEPIIDSNQQGIESFPLLFSCPKEANNETDKHLRTLVVLMSNNDLDDFKVRYLYDSVRRNFFPLS